MITRYQLPVRCSISTIELRVNRRSVGSLAPGPIRRGVLSLVTRAVGKAVLRGACSLVLAVSSVGTTNVSYELGTNATSPLSLPLKGALR